jgi:outer membrane protein assembly factor BamB
VGKRGSYTCSGCQYVYAIKSEDGTIKWQIPKSDPYESGSYYKTALTLDNGILYVGGYHGLYALNSSNGNQEWHAPIGDIDGSIPAISQDTVYVGTDGYALYAITKSDGNIKENWPYGTGARIYASPIIDKQGVIYVGSEDGKFYALNPDGSLKWLAELSDKIQYGAAIGSDGTIYVATYDGKLYAFGVNIDLGGL